MPAQRVIADRYSLVEPLPGSADGIGWRARDLWSGQLVAITRVPVSGLVGDELLRVRREVASEVRVLGGLQHDRLVRTMDVVLDADDLWVASGLLPGVTMAGELARRGVVGPEEVARWGRDVADGLAAAHAVGVPHRNLHAGMVGLAEGGRVVVGGFATTVVTPEGLRNGTPVHVAPEVARGAEPSPASDVFALGAMLYLAVEGRGPFPAADREQLLAAVAFAFVAPQRAGRLSGLLMRMLHPDPAQRPDAAAVADQLRQLAGPPAGVPAGAPGSASVGPPPYRAPLPWVAPSPKPGTPAGLPAVVTDSSAGQWKRMWWVVAVAVVVLWLAGSLLVMFGLPWTSALPGRPAAAPTPPSPIGDPRTADPCGLLNVDSVQRFGPATMVRDIGYPQECMIEISTGGAAFVRLAAVFGAAGDQAPAGVAERFGELTMYRETAGDGSCARTVVLGDRSRAYLTARAYRGATTDLCAVADAGTQTAAFALSSGSLPRRDLTGPPNALTRLDTCALLDQAVLGQVPGLDASRRHPGFAGWLCTWGDSPAFLDDPWVQVAVVRWLPLPGRPVRIAGRSAQVFPGGPDNPGSCEVDLVQRSYPGASGDPRVELLRFKVSLGAQQATEAACRSATSLAEAAAPRLPLPA